ncbi:MAG: NAD kinase [Cytophagales bacterium]|nr:NAD kinase [Cytophagales bacterium]
MKIAVNGRLFKDNVTSDIQKIFDELFARDAEIQISRAFKAFLDKKITLKGQIDTYTGINDIFEADFVFSIGGDGTLLETVTHIGRKEFPILGINSGRLGFLAITPCEIATTAIKSIFDGDYNVDERTLIRLESEENIFEGLNFGLNEFAILKSDTSSMIVVHTYLDGDYLNSYWADGLIVSTPTGSTGYSLSCGGPIVFPHTSNFTISPVSPHNLNVRPMVVSDSSVISFEIEGRSKNFLVSLDSRSKTVDASIKLAVKKEDFKAKLVKVGNENFLNTLRNKLNWGLDIRN